MTIAVCAAVSMVGTAADADDAIRAMQAVAMSEVESDFMRHLEAKRQWTSIARNRARRARFRAMLVHCRFASRCRMKSLSTSLIATACIALIASSASAAVPTIDTAAQTAIVIDYDTGAGLYDK